jgi:hypothetical protein
MTANIEILTAVVATHPNDAATRTTAATITATTDTGISTCASVRTDTTTARRRRFLRDRRPAPSR